MDMRDSLRARIAISKHRVDQVNAFLTDARSPFVDDLVALVEKYGGPDAINARARQARHFDSLMARLEAINPSHARDVLWLREQRDRGAFVSLAEYRERVLGAGAGAAPPAERNPVTLEISALQYFPYLIAEARQAIERRELMPGRFIRVRNMKEQVADGDILAVAAAMQVVGASHVETLDTRGTDGSNVHLGGPETITGYFGGIGQPNEHALGWIDEYLHYYNEFGVQQVLNVNAGTILLALMLHKLGVDIQFKISVYMGLDNPYSLLWVLTMARLFARDDGTTALAGLNLSNSVTADTIERGALARAGLGLDGDVRFEHHITETWHAIVVQPYERRDQLLAVAPNVANMSAKHEGGNPAVERTRAHASSILDYFLTSAQVAEQGLGEALLTNYLDKHAAVNATADALTRAGIGIVPAQLLHR